MDSIPPLRAQIGDRAIQYQQFLRDSVDKQRVTELSSCGLASAASLSIAFT